MNWSSEYTDAIVIATILVVNAVLGFYQEYKAEKSLESLNKSINSLIEYVEKLSPNNG